MRSQSDPNSGSSSSARRAGRNEDVLFTSARGTPLTRDGAAYLLSKYVRRAARNARLRYENGMLRRM
jgi:site-specific recombinase XerD